MRLHIINAQLTCKPQLIYLHLKIIRYYRLRITRDKFHEVILWAWVNPILKISISKYSWTLQQYHCYV